MLRSHLPRRIRPLRVLAVCAPAGVALYVLACGDASNTDAQNYFADSPIVGTVGASDGGGTVVLSDGEVVTPMKDVYVPPVYNNEGGTHDGVVTLTSTMATSASVDLLSTLTIPLTLTSGQGFLGPASLLALSTPNNIGIGFQPDDPMVTPATPGTCNLVITTKNNLAPGSITFTVLAYGGSASVDAGVPLAITITVNPRVTIDIPNAFETNTGLNLAQINIGTPANIATNPIKVVFTNQDTNGFWFLVGADGANVGFPDGQMAIGPGMNEPAFSGGYTDAGTARVIDQKQTVHFYAKGYGSSESIAESGGGVDGGTNLYKGSIQMN